MPKYRSKPVVIDAFKWTGGPNQTEDPEWIVEAIKQGRVTHGVNALYIHTLEGPMKASIGDYIIKGTAGELYPCKSDIFEFKYEKV